MNKWAQNCAYTCGQRKAPTRQRQGFGVNHLESIHMSKDTTTQHTGNTATVTPAGTQQMVRVFDGQIGGLPAQVCNGRELHVFLKNGKQFSDWIKQRISQYGFEENQDFECLSLKSETQRKDGQRGVARSTEYHLTLDMAKELSMVENNEQGRVARRYFIDCEKRMHAPSATVVAVDTHREVAFEGRRIRVWMRDGQPWFSAANVAAALRLRCSNRITRSAAAGEVCNTHRGRQAINYLSSAVTLRAGDYAERQLGDRWRIWAERTLAELCGTQAGDPPLSQRDLACLYALCEAGERLVRAHHELAPVHKAMRSNALFGVPAALETLIVGGRHLRSRFGEWMQSAAQETGVAGNPSCELLGVQLAGALGLPPLPADQHPMMADQPLQGELVNEPDLSPVQQWGFRQLMDTRFFGSFDENGQVQMRAIPADAVLIRRSEIATRLADRDFLTTDQVAVCLEALAKRLKVA